jgi:hypothetical protein
LVYKLGIYGPLTKDAIKAYDKLGIDAVFTEISADVKDGIKNAKNAGLKIYACIWAFKAINDVRCGVKNVNEMNLFWAESGCPNNPMIREYSIRRIKEALQFDIDGIVLDGVRFPSPGSGLSRFLTCFCDYCKKRAKGLGYDLDLVKERLKSFLNPLILMKVSLYFPNFSDNNGLVDWISFRCHSITEYVKTVKKVCQGLDQKAEVGAALFTPSLSSIVGQSYRDLCVILDFIQPMVYHKGNGIACINFELGKLVENLTDDKQRGKVLRMIYSILNYEKHNPPSNISGLFEKGLPLMIVIEEVIKTKKLKGTRHARLTPIIYVIDSSGKEIQEITRQVLNHTEGLVYFCYNEGLKLLDKSLIM